MWLSSGLRRSDRHAHASTHSGTDWRGGTITNHCAGADSVSTTFRFTPAPSLDRTGVCHGSLGFRSKAWADQYASQPDECAYGTAIALVKPLRIDESDQVRANAASSVCKATPGQD